MKSYIIRLKNNAVSEKHAQECVAQAEKFGISVEYFDAITGLDYPAHLEKLNIHPRYKFKKNRAGVYGCFLSHYYLWNQCVRDNVPYLILEHDGYFVRSLPDNVLETFTDVLKLDNLDPYSKHYEIWLSEQQHLPLCVEPYHNPQAKTIVNEIKWAKKINTGNYIKGAYSYIIKPHAAHNIINWISQHGFVPADQQIGSAIVDIRVTIPTVARLHPSYFCRIQELSLTRNPDML